MSTTCHFWTPQSTIACLHSPHKHRGLVLPHSLADLWEMYGVIHNHTENNRRIILPFRIYTGLILERGKTTPQFLLPLLGVPWNKNISKSANAIFVFSVWFDVHKDLKKKILPRRVIAFTCSGFFVYSRVKHFVVCWRFVVMFNIHGSATPGPWYRRHLKSPLQADQQPMSMSRSPMSPVRTISS